MDGGDGDKSGGRGALVAMKETLTCTRTLTTLLHYPQPKTVHSSHESDIVTRVAMLSGP